MTWIWIWILVLVLGVLLFVFMYTLNRKPSETTLDSSKVIVTDINTTVPQTITFYSTVNYAGDLKIYVYKVGDFDNQTIIVNNFTTEPNVIYTEPIDLSALSPGTYNTGFKSDRDGSGPDSIYTFTI